MGIVFYSRGKEENVVMQRRKWIWYLLLGMNVTLLALLGMQYGKNQRIQEQIAGKVLRFHVLANSDTAEDQNLKLAVRDAVGSRMAELLSDVPDREACEQVVEAHLPEIAETAQAVVREAGYEYEVHAAIEETEFPSKTYGKFTFPAGKYEALRVVIGEGEGHNWWCVMFPPLCFVDISSGVVPDESKELLENNLSEEEFALISENDNNTEIQFKFKLLEFFNQNGMITAKK